MARKTPGGSRKTTAHEGKIIRGVGREKTLIASPEVKRLLQLAVSSETVEQAARGKKAT